MTGTGGRRSPSRGILVAADLDASGRRAASTATRSVGIVLPHGSPTLARGDPGAGAREFPLVVGAGRRCSRSPDGTPCWRSTASSGELRVDPDAGDPRTSSAARAHELAGRRTRDLAMAQPAGGDPRRRPRSTMAANIGSVGDARAAFAARCRRPRAWSARSSSSLAVTERRPSMSRRPSTPRIAGAMGGRRITLRTLDVGGDKPLPYVFAPSEDNPFLGRRGIRLALDRARIARRATRGDLPNRARHTNRVSCSRWSPPCRNSSRRPAFCRPPPDRPVCHAGLRVGMMVEVPAAALKIETFLPHLDFVSIGTNDLTQYTLAAERGNPSVAALSDALDPGVLQLIALTCAAATGRVPVAVCGEAGSDPASVAILLGLGVRELSVAPAAIPAIKTLVRSLDLTQCVTLAEKALNLRNAHDVRQLVSAELGLGALAPTP